MSVTLLESPRVPNEAVRDELSIIVERLLPVYDPLRIYLFGSYAWGTPTQESDYDICVIVAESSERKSDRCRKGRDVLMDIIIHQAVDLLVYTFKEFERAALHPSTLASPIKRRGIMLYERAPLGTEALKTGEPSRVSKYHNVWIFKAENDLLLAQIGIQHIPPVLDGAVFHTQQCAEKALKGFLSFRRQEIRKTHNLVELIGECSALDSSFETLLADGDFLTPQATEFRYPGMDDDGEEVTDFSEFMPDFDDVQTSVGKASAILEFVKSKIVT